MTDRGLNPDNLISAEEAQQLGIGGAVGRIRPKPPRQVDSPPAKSRRRKWGNNPKWYASKTVGLRWFRSTKEADRARELDRLVDAGDVIAWWHEAPIYCGFDNEDGTPCRMLPDFKIKWADGTETWEDTKGAKPTEDWRIKRNAVRDLWGIDVQVI